MNEEIVNLPLNNLSVPLKITTICFECSKDQISPIERFHNIKDDKLIIYAVTCPSCLQKEYLRGHKDAMDAMNKTIKDKRK